MLLFVTLKYFCFSTIFSYAKPEHFDKNILRVNCCLIYYVMITICVFIVADIYRDILYINLKRHRF
jgi:hypothetical protein